MHVTPRVTRFGPWQAARGPERKTRFKPSRETVGSYENGDKFKEKDDWQNNQKDKKKTPQFWTGRTIFLVDRSHSGDFGTDQRRQRSTVANRQEHARKVSWADISDSDWEGRA